MIRPSVSHRRPDRSSLSRGHRAGLLLTLVAAAWLTVPGALGCGPGGACAASSRNGQPDVITLGSRPSITIPWKFVGVSLEYGTVADYEGADAPRSNPVLAQLLRNLTPGQPPVVRIGGDSTDWTWWPVPGMRQPAGIRYDLSPSWIADARAFVASVRPHLILGINLETNNTRIGATEAQHLVNGIGRQHIDALEIGNEPELYKALPWYHTPSGHPRFGRHRSYDFTAYTQEFTRYAKALPRMPLAGPSTGTLHWLPGMPQFMAAAPELRMVTFHTYALDFKHDAFRGHNCSTARSDPAHPSVATLLAPYASSTLIDGVAPTVALVHRRGLRFRVDETNAITCGGTAGVSDTFASALWVLDALFWMARAGVDGVNLHSWAGSSGQLFGFRQVNQAWSGSVRPEYYGALMFALAAPGGSRLLPVEQTGGAPVRAWAVRARDRSIHFVLINDSLGQAQTVLVRGPARAGPAELERLEAPSARATGGVTLDCQSFGPETTTGVLAGTACPRMLTPSRSGYRVSLPATSAALLIVPGRRP